MGISPGSIAHAVPPAEDDQVRKQRDLERQARENAAARAAEATTIGAGGLVVKDGGSIRVEAPGTIDLPGGAFSANSLAAATTVTAGGNITSSGGSVVGVNVIASNQVSAATASIGAGGIGTSGPVSGLTGTFNGGLFSTDARNFVVVSSYAACWIDINGHFGISPSSLRFKTGIVTWVPSEERLRSLLSLRGVLFRYIWEEDDDKRQLGWIAEELIEVGWPEFIFYDAEGLPQGINYDRVTVALLELSKWQQRQLDEINGRLSAAGL